MPEAVSLTNGLQTRLETVPHPDIWHKLHRSTLGDSGDISLPLPWPCHLCPVHSAGLTHSVRGLPWVGPGVGLGDRVLEKCTSCPCPGDPSVNLGQHVWKQMTVRRVIRGDSVLPAGVGEGLRAAVEF